MNSAVCCHLSEHKELVGAIIFKTSMIFDWEGDWELYKMGNHRSGQFPNTDQLKTTDNDYITNPIDWDITTSKRGGWVFFFEFRFSPTPPPINE